MNESSSQDCRTVLEGISAYLDGELEATACEAIERHCHDCGRCAALVQGLRDTVGLCQQAAAAPLPELVRQRARASVRRLLDGTSSSTE
jgi:anti-sigma factor RsiW